MNRVLLLVTTATYRAGAFLEAARRLGLAVVVGSERPQALAQAAPEGHLTLDFRAPEDAARAIVAFADTRPLRAVVSADDDGVILAAMASARLGLRHHSVQAVEAARDKHRMRALLARAGVPSPWFEKVPLDADPVAIAQRVPYPCVVKPLALSASRGVIRADDPEQFASAFRRVRSILLGREKAAKGPRGVTSDELHLEARQPDEGGGRLAREGDPQRSNERSGERPAPNGSGETGTHRVRGTGIEVRGDARAAPVAAGRELDAVVEIGTGAIDAPAEARGLLIESYIPGDEVALEGLLRDGRLDVLAIFDKPDPLEGPFFEETIYVTPSRHSESVRRAVADRTAQVAEALGLTEGPVHAELRINGAGPWMLEIAPRSIGGFCSRTLRFGPGISLEELILRRAAGLDDQPLPREDRAAGVMMIPIPSAGVLQGVRGREKASGVPAIEEIRITVPVGQEVVPPPEGSRYLGFIFARAGTPEEVEAALREAHRLLEFEILPG